MPPRFQSFRSNVLFLLAAALVATAGIVYAPHLNEGYGVSVLVEAWIPMSVAAASIAAFVVVRLLSVEWAPLITIAGALFLLFIGGQAYWGSNL